MKTICRTVTTKYQGKGMIEILMSTYNGEKYLRRQMESLLQQTCREWRLTVRDDGSTDKTTAIIAEYMEKYPERMALSKSSGKNVGVIRSFERLLEESEAEYIMFCDQDDVWLPNKVSISLAAIQLQEQKRGKQTPILVHTDLTVVDDNENVINQSYWQMANIKPLILNRDIKYLAVCNSVTGCTVIMNRAAKKVSVPFAAKCEMHDAAIAIAVAAHGHIHTLDLQTILYRQHASNTLGAEGYHRNVWRKLRNMKFVFGEKAAVIYDRHRSIFKSKTEVVIYMVKYALIKYFGKRATSKSNKHYR